MYLRITIFALMFFAPLVQAERGEEHEGKHHKVVIDLAYNQNNGNTNNSSLFSKLALDQGNKKWENSLELSAINNESDGERKMEQYVGIWQSNYYYSDSYYGLGSFRSQENHYGEFKLQSSATVGVGHHFWQQDSDRLSIELGLGMSQSEKLVVDEKEESVVYFTQMHYRHNWTETTQFEQKVRSESSQRNTFLVSDTNLAVAINSSLSLKVGYIMKRNSDVSDGVEKTDSFTHVGVSYTF